MTTSRSTLTREQLLSALQNRFKVVEVAGVGQLLLRTVPDSKRSMRIARMFDDNGKPREDAESYARASSIIDQVMIDEETPMFSEDDIKVLSEQGGVFVDKLIVAINEFNREMGADLGNGIAGSESGNASSSETGE